MAKMKDEKESKAERRREQKNPALERAETKKPGKGVFGGKQAPPFGRKG